MLYAVQIKSLEVHVDHDIRWRNSWPDIFAHTSHTLTSLEVYSSLTDSLVQLLITRTPALNKLTVAHLDLESDHSGEQWAVGTLVEQHSVAMHGCDLEQFSRLPTSKGGQIVVHNYSPEVSVSSDQVSSVLCFLSCARIE